MSYKIQCSECLSEFTQRKNLYAHLRKFHKIEPIFSKKSDLKFQCNVCSKLFSYKSTLVKHSRLHDAGTDRDPQSFLKRSRLLCPYEPCDEKFQNYALLRSHLLDEHSIQVELENLKFDSLESFETWKSNIQRKNSSLYTRDSSPKQLSSALYIQKLYFNCHRSHFFRPTGKGVRCLKSTGSNKIGRACPSRMEVSVIHSEGQPLVKVKFWKTHHGHKLQLDRISLDSQTRTEIAEKLREGVSFEQLLNSIKDAKEYQTNINPRLSLIKRKDLHNIVRDYNIDYHAKRHDTEKDNLLHEELKKLEENAASEYGEQDYEDSSMNIIEEIQVEFEEVVETSEITTVLQSPFNKKIITENGVKFIEQHLDNVISVLSKGDVVELIIAE